MKDIVKIIINIILYLWQLPQNIMGLAMIVYFRKDEKVLTYKNIKYYVAPKMSGAITLGQYVILSFYYHDDIETFVHEFGHTIQSKILGPFYLVIAGLNSLLHAWLHDCRKNGKSYYHFWTEKWANKLALKYLERNNILIDKDILHNLYENS